MFEGSVLIVAPLSVISPVTFWMVSRGEVMVAPLFRTMPGLSGTDQPGIVVRVILQHRVDRGIDLRTAHQADLGAVAAGWIGVQRDGAADQVGTAVEDDAAGRIVIDRIGDRDVPRPGIERAGDDADAVDIDVAAIGGDAARRRNGDRAGAARVPPPSGSGRPPARLMAALTLTLRWAENTTLPVPDKVSPLLSVISFPLMKLTGLLPKS
ncbi:MAG: hypothetical protein WDN72_08125 [Alphaproteobacteria bacterium]